MPHKFKRVWREPEGLTPQGDREERERDCWWRKKQFSLPAGVREREPPQGSGTSIGILATGDNLGQKRLSALFAGFVATTMAFSRRGLPLKGQLAQGGEGTSIESLRLSKRLAKLG